MYVYSREVASPLDDEMRNTEGNGIGWCNAWDGVAVVRQCERNWKKGSKIPGGKGRERRW